jgi:YjbE family integral membrane protein
VVAVDFGSSAFWVALGQILIADILLSGDNAVVIALAARALPAEQQRKAVIIGAGAAIAMRVFLTLVASQLMQLPWLKLVGGALLLYIGVGLLTPDEAADESSIEAKGSMFAAVRTILLADAVMSVDNVIAVAAAAKGDTFLLVLGLLISIPFVVWGSTFLLRLIERFPVIVWAGAALLGFIAGEIALADPAIADWVASQAQALSLSDHRLQQMSGVVGAVLVLLVGWVMLNRKSNPTHSG